MPLCEFVETNQSSLNASPAHFCYTHLTLISVICRSSKVIILRIRTIGAVIGAARDRLQSLEICARDGQRCVGVK